MVLESSIVQQYKSQTFQFQKSFQAQGKKGKECKKGIIPIRRYNEK